ncbi:P-loop containing nucleoside triphosphate hydrolase protein [Flammula alnicola]|nr:P-loop containing nucleoside triphosphate hydrolase protein [Flammula alnicola]
MQITPILLFCEICSLFSNYYPFIIFRVMGPTGVGKSTFINTLLGRSAVAVGHSMHSCTAKIEPIVENLTGTARRLVIVDTPGFDDTYVDDSEISKRISSWMESSYTPSMKVAGIIYLHEITQPRMSENTCSNIVDVLKKLCGPDGLDSVVLGTTKWETLGALGVGEKHEKELKELYWKGMMDAGADIKQARNNKQSAWNIVNVIIDGYTRKNATAFREAPMIMLLGETGAGKSTFIEKAGPRLRQKPIIGHSLASCTNRVSEFKVQDPNKPGCYVTLIDTPGFNDSDSQGDDEQLKMIIGWLKKKSQPDAKLTGIIYLHDISQPRVTKSPTVMNASKISRPPGVLFATTKWSNDQRRLEESRERELETTFPNVTMDRFENTVDSAWKLIGAIVSSPGDVTLRELQTQLESICPQFTREESKTARFFYLLIGRWMRVSFSKPIYG